jgi:glycosyltransferase involved in cell wall biosynthesis
MTPRTRRVLSAVRRRLPAPLRSRLVALARRLRERGLIKVTVIVAAYNSDQAGLERLVGSLDAQSMAPGQFEVLFVDDGSTDDTVERLRRFARTRSNYRIHSIPNSGWSSRPRNVGIGLARGEYVLFMDHDDEVFPRGLELAYEAGRRHGADVVNGKEVRTNWWHWGWTDFARDRAPGQNGGSVPLLPMTPHKLYRREFLDKHGIRFPEGRRVFWEDIDVNVACLAAKARVAVLASYPFYHWVATDSNNSGTYMQDADELYENLWRLFENIDTVLAGTPWRERLIAHQLRGRVLAFQGPSALRRTPEHLAVARPQAVALLERYAPDGFREGLNPVNRARLEVLLKGDTEAQLALARFDRDVTAIATVEDIAWEDGLLVVSASTTLTDGNGDPVRFRRSGDRWIRELPDEVIGLVPAEALDVTAAVGKATMTLSVRGRGSRSSWPVPTKGTVTMEDDGDGTGRLVGRVVARFDVGPTRERQWDTETVWDFAARFEAIGYSVHRALRGGRSAVALTRGRSAIAYQNKDGNFSLDVSSSARTVVGSAKPTADDVSLTARPVRRGTELHAVVALPKVHTSGEVRLDGEVLLGAEVRVPAVLVGDEQGARLEFTATVPAGRYELRAEFDGRQGEAGLALVVGPDGAGVEPAA